MRSGPRPGTPASHFRRVHYLAQAAGRLAGGLGAPSPLRSEGAAPMHRIQITVKRPPPTPVPDLDLRTPSGRQLPF